MAGVFAVIAAAIAFTPAIRSTKIARENASREQWWNRAEWALGLASSSDADDRAVANDALKALSEDATPTEYKMIYLTMKNLQRQPAVGHARDDGGKWNKREGDQMARHYRSARTGRFVMADNGSLQRRIAAGEADPISARERAQLEEIRQIGIRRFGFDPEAQTFSKTA